MKTQTCDSFLALEDTTVPSYSHGVRSERGDLGGPKDSKNRGYFVHSVLLVDGSSEDILDLIERQRWCRIGKGRGA